jgi:hypothetical protein
MHGNVGSIDLIERRRASVDLKDLRVQLAERAEER